MKILITGGAGFIGSNFAKFFIAKYPEAQLINLDKLTYAGNLDNLKELENEPRHKFIRADINEAPTIGKIISEERPEVIINFAAETHVDRSISDPQEFLQTNVIGVQNLLTIVKTQKISKFIQISTDEVYGEILDGEFKEGWPLRPRSPYSAAKAAGDLLCQAHFNTYDTPVMIVRACNAYGPNQYPEKFIPLLITNLIENKKVPIYGTGQQIREWIFVQDLCKAVDSVLQNGRPGEIYNIGTAQRFTNLEVAYKIIKFLNRDLSALEFVKDRPGHDRRYALDSQKIRQELNWRPVYQFDFAINLTIEWYLENQNWWQKIKSGSYQEYYHQQYTTRK